MSASDQFSLKRKQERLMRRMEQVEFAIKENNKKTMALIQELKSETTTMRSIMHSLLGMRDDTAVIKKIMKKLNLWQDADNDQQPRT